MGAKGFEDGKVVVSGGTFVSTGHQQVIFTDSKENTSNDAGSGGTPRAPFNEDYIVLLRPEQPRRQLRCAQARARRGC
ncbi:MAG: hypothetical protein ACLTKG_00200 [Collinsella intestinalis]